MVISDSENNVFDYCGSNKSPSYKFVSQKPFWIRIRKSKNCLFCSAPMSYSLQLSNKQTVLVNNITDTSTNNKSKVTYEIIIIFYFCLEFVACNLLWCHKYTLILNYFSIHRRKYFNQSRFFEWATDFLLERIGDHLLHRSDFYNWMIFLKLLY